MSAPVIWILFPAAAAVTLFILRRYRGGVAAAGLAITLFLAWLAAAAPIGRAISLDIWAGFPTWEIGSTLTVLGRRFILDDASRPILSLIYLAVAFWFGGAVIARSDRLFIPLGLGMAALLTASLAVEPFLYAALLIEMAALVCVPLLAPPGQLVGRGVLRFLTLQTLGMPFLLFSGWLLTGVEADPASSDLVLRAVLLIGLGFAFISAIFPFHTWIPMLAEESHPYPAAFVFFMLPAVVSLFALGLLERYTWLWAAPVVYVALRGAGVLMVVTGGLWAAFERHLGRIMGFAAIQEIGLGLLALSLAQESGGLPATPGETPWLGIFFALLLPRAVGLALWAVALSTILARTRDLHFREVQGLARQMPVAAASLVLAQISLAGFPFLGGFPARLALWTALAQVSLPVALLSLLGGAGLLLSALRTLAVLVMRPEASPPESGQVAVSERRPEIGLLTVGWVLLFLIGLMPQWFLPALAEVARQFGLRGP